ncbi:MAG TPA: lipid A deacylase LpxR family protein [Chitinophagaceae bacterium]|nr:lipid A deacylase LpxR family protein [Chitinophagaceae bacterium]
MKNLQLPVLCFAVFIASGLYSQQTTKTFKHEITFTTDNDDYTIKYTDRYYTNGFFLKFATALKDIDKDHLSSKKILTLEFAQQIYNPYRHDLAYLNALDRPFAGVLYVKGGITKIRANENIYQLNIQSGIIGPAAKGKEIHRWWHNIFGLPKIYGWETQLNNEGFVNFSASYHHHLTRHQEEKPWYDAFAFASASLGNNYSGVTTGLQLKLGAFEKAYNSVAWNAKVQRGKQSPNYRRNHELYFYFEPQLTYQFYNAYLQGGFFINDKGFYHVGIKNIIYQHNFGVLFTKGHWTTQLGFTFKTREAQNQIATENFGTIRLGYRFR